MERAQANRFHPKRNEKWQKKAPSQEQRPPNPLESTNLVDHQAIPFCRPCEDFHEESTCPYYLQICEGQPSQSGNEQISMCG